MKAYVLRSYGSPDELQLTDVATPVPGPGEVLVRVRATSVQPWDWHHMRGEPYLSRLMPGSLGLREPKITILGADVAGEVAAVGEGVTEFAPGDEVFAMPPEGGGFGEYVCIAERLLAPKPKSLSFEQAAAVPLAAGTALLAVRDAGRVEPGRRVLINGASGGVGTFAVQLAKAYGAHVTAVCGARNADLVRSLGADEVIDYKKEDFTRGAERYDVLLYLAGNRSFAECRRVLTRKGVCVLVGAAAGRWVQPMGRMMGTLAAAAFTSQKAVLADVVGYPDSRGNLLELTAFIEDGTLRPVIDRVYPFEDLRAAVRYQEEGHAPGKVVVTV
ncbi:NAD(P)-dependent alcohol dehydrogenase [Spongiactinospora sp. TRM90649]|uniref:NAD(P)-dependent alcohol dehydrogenase n=1 Tax=Spongiactinospora sp. TRM90649 TaxID=3031114 RepID=UPI0023F8D704|nr:NAD(P)-dependent alcohol dehydrogenase [Spongiactinospora sp. TRM90649]MDF5756289.1 NAD(P)-dependent alcohol dehydrogenase [Spongiactinospora sp. TRM90649]